jgi:hypothetical protein
VQHELDRLLVLEQRELSVLEQSCPNNLTGVHAVIKGRCRSGPGCNSCRSPSHQCKFCASDRCYIRDGNHLVYVEIV